MKDAFERLWPLRRLGDLTDKIGSGATPKGGQSAYKSEGISLIRSLNVHDLEFRYKDLAKIDDEQAAALSNVEVEARDVLLNITGASIARCSQVPTDILPARVNQHVSIIRPKSDALDSRFLSYLLVSDGTKDQLLNIGDKAGATRQALTKAQLQSFEIPIPPLEEQKRIVEVLDQAFAALYRARDHAETNLLDLDDLIMSASRKAFDALEAEWRPIGSLCEIYQPKTVSAKDMSPNGEFVVFGANGKIGRYHAYNHAEPQLLVTCRGATCGQINISEPFSWITGNAMVVRPKGKEITSNFLEHFFRDAVDWDEIITGAAQPQITRKSFSPMLIPVPALKDQVAIAETLGALRKRIETLKSEYETKLGEVADLRRSLLQKAFSGQLT